MKSVVLMAIFASLLSLVGCGKHLADDSDWSIATGNDHGFPLIVRYRNSIPKGIERKNYPTLMCIRWEYGKRENGMPTTDENTKLEGLESLLEKGLEKKEIAILTAAVTCNGAREWQYYSKSDDGFMRALNEALDGKPVCPIVITHDKDPNWSAWTQICTLKVSEK
jgi:hypothetical protein